MEVEDWKEDNREDHVQVVEEPVIGFSDFGESGGEEEERATNCCKAEDDVPVADSFQ